MKTFPTGACWLMVISYLCWIPKGRCEQPAKAEGMRPSEFPSMLDLHGLELGFSEPKNFAMHILFDPPLSFENIEPIGVFVQTLKYSIGRANGEGAGTSPKRLCAFEGLMWTLVDQFGYSARALVGRDQSLVGFSFRVWNNSRTHPLIFTLTENQPLFLAYAYIDDEDYSNRPKNAAGKEAEFGKEVEWTLKPRESKVVFVSIRSLLPEGLHPKDGKVCHFGVFPNMNPKDAPKKSEPQFPGISGFSARISAQSLAMDVQEGIKEAEANTPDIMKKK